MTHVECAYPVTEASVCEDLAEFMIKKLRAQNLIFGTIASKITSLVQFLEKLRRSGQVYERFISKLLGMNGERGLTGDNIKHFLKFREFVAKCLKVSKLLLKNRQNHTRKHQRPLVELHETQRILP